MDDHDARRPPVRRLARPGGFLLALLLFLLLPTVAASCSAGGDTLTGSVSGTDVLAGNRPSLDATGKLTGFLNFTANSPLAADLDRATPGSGARLVAVVVVLLLLLGGAVELIRAHRRPAVTAIVAAATGVALVGVELMIAARWKPILGDAGLLTRELPENRGRDSVQVALDTLHAGLGFWLVLATLAVIAAVNVVFLLRRARVEAAPVAE
jgi:hypothetical protein